jgi:Tol biopolymer transport system component
MITARSGWLASATILLLCASARAQTTTRVSVGPAGVQALAASSDPSISSSGRYVVFTSAAANLVTGDTNAASDVFVRDRPLGTTERASVGLGGLQANAASRLPAISADGRYVAFASTATNLVTGDTNAFEDTFVRDRQSGTTERVSVDSSRAQGNNASSPTRPDISADGRYVAFASLASNLVTGDTNAFADVFVRDRQSGTTERVSVDSVGAEGNGPSDFPSISADGRYVAFRSGASNLVPGDTNLWTDIFVHDRQTGTTVRASVDSSGVQGNNSSDAPSISADGRYVAFLSESTNLVPGDTNGYQDIFVRDLQSATTERASVDSTGVEADFVSLAPRISADGRHVAFTSYSDSLVPGDTNGSSDIFVRDLQNGTTERASVDTAGAEANNASSSSSISSDGHYVAFVSSATNLVSGDTNGFADVFVRDREATFTPFCFGDGTGAACPCGNSGLAGRGCQNSASTGGAHLVAGGAPSLSADTLQFTSSGELPVSLSIFLQGSASIAAVHYGDGLRCTGGLLKRLRAENAVGGITVYPDGSETPVHTRSAALGDTIQPGFTRYYQVYYRDANAAFCPSPTGSTFNVSNGMTVVWAP